MLWKFLRLILSTYFLFYFRKAKGKNLSPIRVKKPVLLAINHPNAFVDSIILSILVFSPRTYYMARGDAFKEGFISYLLTSIGIIPIFRMRDGGIEGVKKNNNSFSIAYKMWNKGQKIMVFPEGLCVQERKLRPIQKGTARMAFGYCDEYLKDDLLIIPVSVTYSHPSKFGSDIYYHVGETIEVKDYLESYHLNQAKAINELTKSIESKMKVLTPHLNDTANDILIEQLQEIYKEQYLIDNKLPIDDLENHQKFWFYITNQLNLITETSVVQIEKLRQLVNDYSKKLSLKGISDKEIYNNSIKQGRSSIITIFLLFLFFPFYLVGKIINFTPKSLAQKFANKVAKNIEFYASINYGGGAVFAFLFMLIELLVIWFVFKTWWYLPIYLGLKLVFGYFALIYSRFRTRAYSIIKFNSLNNSDNKVIEELSLMRAEILVNLTELKP